MTPPAKKTPAYNPAFVTTLLGITCVGLCLLLVITGRKLHQAPVSNQPFPAPAPAQPQVLAGETTAQIVVDHSSVALFDQIPPAYLEAARNLKVMFSDRSVGQNLHEYLNCFTAASWAQAPSSCRKDYSEPWKIKTYTQADLNQGIVPPSIQFTPDPVKYDRRNWTYVFKMGTWYDLTKNFITVLAPQYLDAKQVLTYQFSYLNVTGTENINDPQNGFFAQSTRYYDVYDLEAFMAAHPDKQYFFWTTSLARSIGTPTAAEFNQTMRQFTSERQYPLFDVADIEAYTASGQPCFDNRDNQNTCIITSVTNCENYPDDGQALPAICQDYTSEIDGGHLGSTAAGGIRLAKAFWVMMARLAGWNPEIPATPVSPPSSLLPSPTTPPPAPPSPTPLPSLPLTPTSVPTLTSAGSAVHVGDIDTEIKYYLTQYWGPRFRVYVHNQNHLPVAGAMVSGTMTYADKTVSVSCSVPTNNVGFCNLDPPGLLALSTTSVDFAVTQISSAGSVYQPETNHDPDADSTGFSATAALQP